MHIPLPDGDVLIPDPEFAELIGVTRRTLGNLDHQGLPYVMVGGLKYRPRDEGLTFIASRIQRRNPRRQAAARLRREREAAALESKQSV